MAQRIAAAQGKKLVTVPGVTWALKLMGCATELVNKAFGNLTYDQSISQYREDYRIVSFEDSIMETEARA